MSFQKIMRFFTSFILGFLMLVYKVSAETGISCNPEKEICNTITSNTFAEVMAKIAEMVAKVGLPIVVIMLIWSGFLFVSAGGNEEKLKSAKSTFFWAVIGGLVVVGAYAISVAIENFAKQL